MALYIILALLYNTGAAENKQSVISALRPQYMAATLHKWLTQPPSHDRGNFTLMCFKALIFDQLWQQRRRRADFSWARPHFFTHHLQGIRGMVFHPGLAPRPLYIFVVNHLHMELNQIWAFRSSEAESHIICCHLHSIDFWEDSDQLGWTTADLGNPHCCLSSFLHPELHCCTDCDHEQSRTPARSIRTSIMWKLHGRVW